MQEHNALPVPQVPGSFFPLLPSLTIPSVSTEYSTAYPPRRSRDQQQQGDRDVERGSAGVCPFSRFNSKLRRSMPTPPPPPPRPRASLNSGGWC
ncbi:hypothetical protein GQ607_016884 [Colletotrichum asianum]|uniref:Uncharacterized protein n=1 Tax=Colletotrichum asianum TaxID=702518 RepID=A0A8H3ZLA8_9PEZI|nr:hypothetical protein GQ607_016884 [Colletotrichum asianum]